MNDLNELDRAARQDPEAATLEERFWRTVRAGAPFENNGRRARVEGAEIEMEVFGRCSLTGNREWFDAGKIAVSIEDDSEVEEVIEWLRLPHPIAIDEALDAANKLLNEDNDLGASLVVDDAYESLSDEGYSERVEGDVMTQAVDWAERLIEDARWRADEEEREEELWRRAIDREP